jgi:Asp-tRNA(Asn)/Glu-tRNA(Gln) amidotransferase A subunit family amidase
VAAGFCPLALGTQTIGSVIRPAAYCGVVGFKPSYGRIPTGGVLLAAESFDTLGLLATDLAWVERAAPVLCSWWRPVGLLRSPVLARPDGPYLDQASAEGRAVLEGLDAAPVPFFADIERINADHHRLMRFELARHHARWYPRLAECYHPSTVAAIRDGLEVDPAEAAQIRHGRLELRARIHAAMDAAGIDLWVCPAASGPAPAGLASTGDPHLQLPWTHAGLPAVTLPRATAANGLPLGLQLVGRFRDDERLLAWAAQLVRRAPAVRA